MPRFSALRTSHSEQLLSTSGTAGLVIISCIRSVQQRSRVGCKILRGLSGEKYSEACRYGTTSCQPGTTSSAATRKPARGCATAAQPGKSTHPTGVEQVRMHVPLHKHIAVCRSWFHANARATGRVNRGAVLAAYADSPKRSNQCGLDPRHSSRNGPGAVHVLLHACQSSRHIGPLPPCLCPCSMLILVALCWHSYPDQPWCYCMGNG